MAGTLPQRDLAAAASIKLAQEWTSCAFINQLTPQRMTSDNGRVDSLDPLLRIRLLLSGLYLSQPLVAEVRAELQRLAGHARNQEDEWLRIIGLTVGDFSGTLDTQALLQESVVVRDSVASIEHELEQAAPQPAFRPLEDAYLNRDVAESLRGFPALAPKHKHFQLRTRPGPSLESGKGTAAGPSRAASEGVGRAEASASLPNTRPEPVHSPSRKASSSITGKASLQVDVSSVFRTSRPDFKASTLPQADKKLENRDVKTKQLGVETVAELNQRSRHPKKEMQPEEAPAAEPVRREAPRDVPHDEEMADVSTAADSLHQLPEPAQANMLSPDIAPSQRKDVDEEGELSEDDSPAQKRLRADEGQT